MKGLILSGGFGTRLRPLTHTSAKQLIPVANKPILHYAIEALKRSGIKDIGIVVGDTRQEIKSAIGSGKDFGVKITYIEQEKPLGLAHAVKISKKFIKDESFVMYLGDNILKDGIFEFVETFRNKKSNANILLTRVPHPEHFGVAELDRSGKVVKLTEKPKNPKSNLALVGIYIFDKNIFKAVEKIKPSSRNELEITDAIQWLIDNGFTVESHEVSGWWKDTGKPEDILEANQLVLEDIEGKIEGKVDKDTEISGRVVIEKGAEIVKSQLRGPLIIGAGSKIIRSYIGPFTSIGNSARIESSEIEHSIILPESEIIGIQGRIDQSLIGRGVKIVSRRTKPSTHRFILGDRSDITLA